MLRVSFLGALLLLLACGGGSVDRAAEFEALIEQNEVEEVLARAQLYLDEGEETGPVYFARGWAELQQDADRPARASCSARRRERPGRVEVPRSRLSSNSPAGRSTRRATC